MREHVALAVRRLCSDHVRGGLAIAVVFTLVVWLNDAIVRAIGLLGALGGAPTRRDAHRRTLSESVESVEEGEGEGGGGAVPVVPAPKAGTPRIRVSRGARAAGSRKLD